LARQVVHDNVGLRQFGREHLGDIGLEGVAVDQAVEDEGRDEATKG
jgi:hypothetical protein